MHTYLGGMNKIVTNLTNLTDAQNFYGVMKFVYDITGGIFGTLFIVTIEFILLMIFLRNYSFEESLLGSSFLVMFISIFLRVMGLISFELVIWLAVIVGISALWVYIAKK